MLLHCNLQDELQDGQQKNLRFDKKWRSIALQNYVCYNGGQKQGPGACICIVCGALNRKISEYVVIIGSVFVLHLVQGYDEG